MLRKTVTIENSLYDLLESSDLICNYGSFSNLVSNALELLIEKNKKEQYKKAMIEASKDRLYIQDIQEVMDDFKYADNEVCNEAIWYIYLADLNPIVGREQSGTRPVLIISNKYENILDIVTVIPITSLKNGRKIYPNELLLDELLVPSILLCQQIRAIAKSRLIKKLSSISNIKIQNKILQILCNRFEKI